MKILLITVSLIGLLALSSDSITPNKEQTLQSFQNSRANIHAAAYYDSAAANFLLAKQFSQSDKHKSFLTRAALNGHVEAMWRLSQLFDNQQGDYWLAKASELGHLAAQTRVLKQYVTNRNWPQAKSLAAQIKLTDSELSSNTETWLRAVRAKNDFPDALPVTKLNTHMDCVVTILPLVINQKAQQTFVGITEKLRNSNLASLPICFKPQIISPELYAICSPDSAARMRCDTEKLAALVKDQGQVSQLLIITDQGKAYTQGGLMLMDTSDDLNVFIHELGHWFGLVDEYEPSLTLQKQLCVPNYQGWIGHNVLIAPNTVERVELERNYGQTLRLVDTCAGIDPVNAYSILAEFNFMATLRPKLLKQDAELLRQSLTKYKPFTMAQSFAHYFKRKDHSQHLRWKQLSLNEYKSR